MLGWAGVLNISMVTIALLYIVMGSFGYLRYGEATKGSHPKRKKHKMNGNSRLVSASIE